MYVMGFEKKKKRKNKGTAPTNARNGELRRDFILTMTKTPKWNPILVVGDHQSKGSKPFTHAEDASIAQPFCTTVLGILTSNISPQLT